MSQEHERLRLRRLRAGVFALARWCGTEALRLALSPTSEDVRRDEGAQSALLDLEVLLERLASVDSIGTPADRLAELERRLRTLHRRWLAESSTPLAVGVDERRGDLLRSEGRAEALEATATRLRAVLELASTNGDPSPTGSSRWE